jgi:hypothetical protein
MGKLYCLDDARRSRQKSRHKKPTFFSRTELNQLLSLYSRRVSSGEWRDYAIDQRAGMAVFSVFRHTHDRPVFCIAKRSRLGGRGGEFLVYAGAERLKKAESIAEALAVLNHKPRLVFSTSA